MLGFAFFVYVPSVCVWEGGGFEGTLTRFSFFVFMVKTLKKHLGSHNFGPRQKSERDSNCWPFLISSKILVCFLMMPAAGGPCDPHLGSWKR